MVLHMDGQGKAVHVTPVHRLVLPPPIPGRAEPVFNGNGQYRLPDPITGTVKSYTRASTVAGTLEDTFLLDAWTRRMILIGIARSDNLFHELTDMVHSHIEADPANVLTLAKDLRAPLNAMADTAHEQAGGSLQAEFGTAVHAWCEYVDLGLCHTQAVPTMFFRWVLGHRRALAEAGLRAVPGWTERVVLNTQYGIAGTLDRVFQDADGNLILGDIKTSRGMEFSWLHFAIQLAIYHGASHVLSEDGTAWVPMPKLEPTTALISHIPREDPDGAHIVPMDMVFGAQALFTAMTVRKQRTAADKHAQSVRYGVGSSDPDEVRRRRVRYTMELLHTEDDMALLWEENHDIWTDDMTELAQRTVQLATQRNAFKEN